MAAPCSIRFTIPDCSGCHRKGGMCLGKWSREESHGQMSGDLAPIAATAGHHSWGLKCPIKVVDICSWQNATAKSNNCETVCALESRLFKTKSAAPSDGRKNHSQTDKLSDAKISAKKVTKCDKKVDSTVTSSTGYWREHQSVFARDGWIWIMYCQVYMMIWCCGLALSLQHKVL